MADDPRKLTPTLPQADGDPGQDTPDPPVAGLLHSFDHPAIPPVRTMEAVEPLRRRALVAAEPPPTMGDRIRGVWNVAEGLVEQAVLAAEILLGNMDGQAKKLWVTNHVLQELEELEKRYDLVPNWIQPIVMHGIRKSLSWFIERIFRQLKAREFVR